MKLGAHCVLYGAEIAEDTDAVISRLADVGAEGCELGERFFGVEDREKLSSILEKNNIALAGMHCNNLSLIDLLDAPEKSREALEKVAGFVAEMPDKNIIATGMVGDMSEMRTRTLAQGAADERLHKPESVKLIAERLNEITCGIKEKYGVQVHYHNHSWEFCDDGLIWYTLAKYAPQLMFALDTGWAAASGFEPTELIKKYPGRFHYVHLRDYSKNENPSMQNFEEVHKGFVSLGTGSMNYPRLMRCLDSELSENDWAIVEYELGNFDKDSYIKAISYLKGIKAMLKAEGHHE